jgi:hypothetical protein
MVERAAPVPGAAASRWIHRLAAPAAIAACVMVFYWVPMTSSSASIQWEAADVHYPMQRYLSDRLSPRRFPFWTPYVLSGYPILANPEVGAWYPPNWPFFLAGITPRSIQLELALNAFLACLGAYLLISGHVESRMAAILGAFAYGLSGFFAGHASQVSLFAGAAMFPWLLLAYRRAIDVSAVRYTALGGLVGAALILAGSGPAAVYELPGTGPVRLRRLVARTAGLAAQRSHRRLHAGGRAGLRGHSIVAGPGTRRPLRARGGLFHPSPGVLHPGSLMTLVAPNWLGSISGGFKPSDMAQYYFYAGLLVLPLAAIGVVKSGMRLPGLLLIVPPVWYMLGPAGGLYYLGALAPSLRQARCAGGGLVPGRTGAGVAGGGGWRLDLCALAHGLPATAYGRPSLRGCLVLELARKPAGLRPRQL